MTDRASYGADIGRLPGDYAPAFLIRVTAEGYCTACRGPGGLPRGPEVRDATCDTGRDLDRALARYLARACGRLSCAEIVATGSARIVSCVWRCSVVMS
ncbi:MAG: hypothetical protein M3Y33_03505 [Actinomycetota bacterium]|nr:hypothetical protein [Actinomycetota bacterium]